MIDKNEVLKKIELLIDNISSLKSQTIFSEEHTKWVVLTLELLEKVFGPDSRYYLTFAGYPWKKMGKFIVGGPYDREGSLNPQKAIEREDYKAYLEQLDSAKGLLEAAYTTIKQTEDINILYKCKESSSASNLTIRVVNIAEKSLRKAIKDTPSSEKEIQNAFENLLIGADINFSRETQSIEYSSKTYKPDFIITDIELAVELKFCARKEREKELIAEINDDIMAYSKEYKSILFIVYDLGIIRDVDKFADEFVKNQNIFLTVVKH